MTHAKSENLKLRIDPAMGDALRALAARNERSVAAEIRLAIKARLESENGKDAS